MAAFFQQLLRLSLEPLLNQALNLDPQRDRLLKPLQGKIIRMQLTQPNLSFDWVFAAQSLHLLTAEATAPDAGISTSGIDLWQQLLHAQHINPKSSLRITGDALLIQDFWRLCTQLNPQWEQWLAPFVGNTAAFHIGRHSRNSLGWVKHSAKRMQDNLSDYLQFDAHWWVSHAEAEVFFNEVDQLRHHTERLEMRLARLQNMQTVVL